MGCSGCSGVANVIKRARKIGNDIVGIISGRKVTKSVWEARMNICKNCGWFKALNWECQLRNTDSRQLCWNGKCPQSSWV